MAGIVVMRALYQALGCSDEVANFLTDEEGLEDCEDLAELDPADIRQLMKNARNPGGGEEGHMVSTKATCRLIHASHYCKISNNEGWSSIGCRECAPWRCAQQGEDTARYGAKPSRG